jgi:tetratricopeptide (TPR) repeat protein
MTAGELAAGRDYYREAAALYAELGDGDGLAMAENHLADAQADAGDYTAAIAAYRRAASLFRELGDTLGEVYCTFGVGDSLAALGDQAGAAEAWRAGLAILGDADHPEAMQVRAKLANIGH